MESKDVIVPMRKKRSNRDVLRNPGRLRGPQAMDIPEVGAKVLVRKLHPHHPSQYETLAEMPLHLVSDATELLGEPSPLTPETVFKKLIDGQTSS